MKGCLYSLEKKAKLYSLKKKKIYQKVVDVATLDKREKMKELILSRKIHWFPPMTEFKDKDSKSSSIDFRRDSKLKAKLNASFVVADQLS